MNTVFCMKIFGKLLNLWFSDIQTGMSLIVELLIPFRRSLFSPMSQGNTITFFFFFFKSNFYLMEQVFLISFWNINLNWICLICQMFYLENISTLIFIFWKGDESGNRYIFGFKILCKEYFFLHLSRAVFMCSSVHFEGLSIKYGAISAYLWPLSNSFQISDRYLGTSEELEKESERILYGRLCIFKNRSYEEVFVGLFYYIYNSVNNSHRTNIVFIYVSYANQHI